MDDNFLETVEYFESSLSSDDSCVEFKQQINQIVILDNDCKLCLLYDMTLV